MHTIPWVDDSYAISISDPTRCGTRSVTVVDDTTGTQPSFLTLSLDASSQDVLTFAPATADLGSTYFYTI